jgi:hypothetical protein
MIIRFLQFVFFVVFLASCKPSTPFFDVVVVGGGASGVTAGIQSARMETSTLIVEESTWLGGMLTGAGVSAIDGNYNLPSGLWGEFKDELIKYYGNDSVLKSGWVSHVLFEPSVGDKLLKQMVGKEKNLSVMYQSSVIGVRRMGDKWAIQMKDAQGQISKIECAVLIDATELGDIAAMCGVGYDIGMDSRHETNESIAPEEKNNIIQDLTYVAILKDYGKDMTIERPASYDSTLFSCCCANDLCISPKEPHRVWAQEMMMTYGKLPNGKYMINWPIEGNDYYLNVIEMTPEQRVEALKEAKAFTMSFLYFMQKELGLNTLYLADDEFPTEDLLPFIPYHRESRRIHGLVQFTLNHITHPYDQKLKLYRTNIGVGDYPVDHHHARYHGWSNLPDLYFFPIPSYGLPLGTIIPKEVKGLIVAEKSISVTNLVNGTTRLQPVVLQIGQAAGVLAALAVNQNKAIDEVAVRDVQEAILASGGYLMPYLDYPKEHSWFKALQRIGSTGAMKGIGKNVDWSNQTWFRADTLLLASELNGLSDLYPAYAGTSENHPISIAQALAIVDSIVGSEGREVNDEKMDAALSQIFHSSPADSNRFITRGEMAVLLDLLIDPFHTKEVDVFGNYK